MRQKLQLKAQTYTELHLLHLVLVAMFLLRILLSRLHSTVTAC